MIPLIERTIYRTDKLLRRPGARRRTGRSSSATAARSSRPATAAATGAILTSGIDRRALQGHVRRRRPSAGSSARTASILTTADGGKTWTSRSRTRRSRRATARSSALYLFDVARDRRAAAPGRSATGRSLTSRPPTAARPGARARIEMDRRPDRAARASPRPIPILYDVKFVDEQERLDRRRVRQDPAHAATAARPGRSSRSR